MNEKERLEINFKLAKLACLEACGVDNWVGYDYVYELMKTEYPVEYKWYFGEDE